MNNKTNEIPSPCLEEARQIVDAHELASELDAGFDGGEFSGPAHHDAMQRQLNELAARYDVDPDHLLSAAFTDEG